VTKRVISILLIIMLFISVPAFSKGESDEIGLIINGQKIECDVSPEIINGRTLVPARVIFDSFGAEVFWNDSLRQVVVSTSASVIIFNIGSKIAYVNGVAFNIDVAPVIMNGRTLIPVRFISERMGYDVVWNGTDRTVNITSSKVIVRDEVYDKIENEKTDNEDNNNYDESSKDIRTQLRQLTVTNNDDTCYVKVSFSQKVIPNEMRLSSPDRIVLDFENVNQICKDEKIDFEDSDIIQVRWAYHDDYTRLVIETNQKLDYTLKYTSTSCTVVIEKENVDKPVSDNKTEQPSGDEDVTDKEIIDKDVIFTPPILDSKAPIIVIDPGHGGYDAGAVGRDDSGEIVIREKDANLTISLKVEKRLKSDGINVVMTRNTDKALGTTVMEDLVTRAEIANRVGADLFISIHNNASENSDATGTSVLYPGLANSGGYGITSKELAQNIQNPMAEATGLKDRGIVESPEMVVLKRTKMPAVLLECAFVTNEGDRAVLLSEERTDAIADAIYKGIVNSLRTMGKVK